MENSNISSLMETTMGRIREMVDVNTVVGSPITTPDGITVIPVSRISYAFATGGSDFRIKEKPGFGGPPPMMMDEDEEGGGMPPMFGPPKAKMPISKGPFYALKLKLFHENAVGGMTIDEHASVLKQGKPVPGLYAAGDTTRGIMIPGDIGVGYIEMVFTALTQAFNEGYIAGVEAAAYTE